ncbi:hypothetical protein DFH28DRAFT_877858 [Melampsora americana]|nr:hypothetical protein DFH28DRAFT_877858 [Melampsora americana]
MNYLHLIIFLYIHSHTNPVISGPFEVSSHDSPILEHKIGSCVNDQESPKTHTPKSFGSIESLKPNKISDLSSEGRNTFNKEGSGQSSMDNQINYKDREIYQYDFDTIDPRSQERGKGVSESHSNSQEIVLFGKRIKVKPVHTIEMNPRLIEIPKTNPLKLSEGLAKGTSTSNKEDQSIMDQHTNHKRKEIHQEESNTIGFGSQESKRSEGGSNSQSTIEEMTAHGKRIKANPIQTIDLRNLATDKMNRLCVFYSRYLVEEFTYSMINKFKREKGLQYHPDLFKQYNTSLFAPFVYFILLRDPRKAVWDRVLSITGSIIVEFHKQESRSGGVYDSEKLYTFMLWHTEMMYYLTNPKLLDHINRYQDILTQSSITEINRQACPIAVVLSMISSKLSFERLFERSQGLSKLSASYLTSYWNKDYEHNYPVSRRSNNLQSSIKKEWDRISKSILESCTLTNPMGFFNDLSEIKEERNQEKIRQDLSERKDSTLFQGLVFWIKKHEEQKMKFSDLFCVTAIFNFFESKSSGIDYDLFWKEFEKHEIKRKHKCARKTDYYHKFRKFKLSKPRKMN